MTAGGPGQRDDAIEDAATLVAGAPPQPASHQGAPALPHRIDRFEILGFLGAGGMGAVYRARDTELGELVALKMLRDDVTQRPDAIERFRDEVRLARRVTHRNVARTYDIGEHQGQRFLTMELVDGVSLAAHLGERGPLPPADVVALAVDLCAGLAAAHRVGVIHHDLKPENVMLARDGRVVITDFGIARTHRPGDPDVLAGTPAYMAPEQFSAGPVDHRVDLYALGAVLFELLTGRRAFDELEFAGAAGRPAAPDPRQLRSSIPAGLARVVLRCLEPVPANRYTDADALALHLRAALASGAAASTSATPYPGPPRVPASKTLAVLPLRNDGRPDDAYLADGLTDDLIDTLSTTPGLRVRPRGVVLRYRGDLTDPQAVGRELGIDAIVEGSVRRHGDAVRLGLRLIGVADGFQLWAGKFDAPVGDLLVVNAGAAAAIARALTTELPEETRPAIPDPAAVDLYLRAKFEFWRSWHSSPARAVELFERALSLAPADPRVLAGLAIALARMVVFGEGDADSTLARARELTERAVLVAPALGEVWAALANCRLVAGDPVGTARALRSGLAHAPNTALLQDLLGRVLAEVGPLDPAVVRLRFALDLDPTLISARVDLSRVYALLGDTPASEVVLDAIAPGEPSTPRDSCRARWALWRRDPPPFATTPPDSFLRLTCELLADGVLTPDHRAFMRARADAAASRMRPFFFQRNAEFLAFAGDRGGALEALERSIEAGLFDLSWCDRCPLLAPLRDDPRWPSLRATVAARAGRIREALGHTP